jgi:hypothetical protein
MLDQLVGKHISKPQFLRIDGKAAGVLRIHPRNNGIPMTL